VKGQVLIKFDRVSDFVTSKEGEETQKKLWTELSEKLEKIQPGIMSAI
jgi:retinol dehydrogenase-12